jgi:hypothetical protein
VLEVTSAAFVLLLAIASSLIVLQAGFRAIDLARGTTLVSQVLQSEIETLRMMGWGEIAKLPENHAVRVAWTYDGSVQLPPTLTVTRTVTAVAASEDEEGSTEPDLRQITVTANWRTVDGAEHARSTSTQYGRNGLNDYYASSATR